MRVRSAGLYFLEIPMRVPLKFGDQTLTEVTCARVRVRVSDASGRRSAEGWGETPLSVGWVWPSTEIPYEERHRRMKGFCAALVAALASFGERGHAFEIGHAFIAEALHPLVESTDPGLPHLAALVCFSAFDLALHDAFGQLHDRPVYETYNREFMVRDLSAYLEPRTAFAGKYPADFLTPRQDRLPVWHLVGGLDPLAPGDLTGGEPDDGYPVLLRDWIRRDGLKCLKIKLRGNDADWDYHRLVRIGQIAGAEAVDHLTADFNCTVRDPAYVNTILDRLQAEHPATHAAILYVEQPFPYDLEANPIDVTSVSARKPLYLDESAHDWTFVRLGRSLGWSGVALKTCKTQTGALLSLCWARAHGMGLMVQDLTNPMLAQIPHVLLAAHAGTIMGVESNGMQFYPEASRPEGSVHPGLYRRRGGILDLSTLRGAGFGYRLDEIPRELPEAAAVAHA
ncbi:mandelate racemase/muconate lactonizing enzyme family protein [soil metagenome]